MKILIVTGRFGMGHYSAAEALREELLLETPRPDVEVVDAVEAWSVTCPAFSTISAAWPTSARFPCLRGFSQR